MYTRSSCACVLYSDAILTKGPVRECQPVNLEGVIRLSDEKVEKTLSFLILQPKNTF